MARRVAFCTFDGDVDRHDWRWTAVVGLCQCRACGGIAVCPTCYQALNKPMPAGALRKACPAHSWQERGTRGESDTAGV
jgi:hypothetical protein